MEKSIIEPVQQSNVETHGPKNKIAGQARCLDTLPLNMGSSSALYLPRIPRYCFWEPGWTSQYPWTAHRYGEPLFKKPL